MQQVELRTRLQESLGSAFTLERELPRGGMSRVFAATENAFGRKVVMKVLSPELAATISAERFKREITLAARLQHPHIVPLISAGEAGGSLYYTMPLVDGELLRERMSRDRQMPLDEVARVLEEVCAALAFAHEQGVVHRDIKPENIMFFHDQAVVMDFGIARALTASSELQEAAGVRITVAGMALGTPTYIAPEQASGDASLDHRADLYALGVVAYEMLTGHPPFAGRSPQAVMAAHANQAPQPVAERRPGVPAPLARIVMKCLEKQPADRPQSAREIARVVSAMRPSGPTELRGPLWTRVPPWVPWAVAATMTVVAVVAAVIAMRCRC